MIGMTDVESLFQRIVFMCKGVSRTIIFFRSKPMAENEPMNKVFRNIFFGIDHNFYLYRLPEIFTSKYLFFCLVIKRSSLKQFGRSLKSI